MNVEIITVYIVKPDERECKDDIGDGTPVTEKSWNNVKR